MKEPSFTTWVYWLGATITAAMMLTSFAYSNFQTKTEAAVLKNDLERRLERIEGKIDYLIMKEKKNSEE